MSGKLTRRGFVALGAGLLLGGALTGTVLAQQSSQTPWGGGACPMGFGGGPSSGGRPGAGPAGMAGAPHAAIASALGMSPDDLFASMRGGKTIAQIAQEKGIDLETVVQAALAAHDKALDARVQAGLLTQEQADQMDAHMEANIRAMIAGGVGAGMMSGGFGPGMMPGGHGPGMMPGGFGPGMMPGFGPRRQGQ